jgi:hypothetical protein
MKKFPYKDPDINSWIYDQVPDKMELATSEKQLKIGSLILFKSSFSSLAGYFIATKVNITNIETARHYLRSGRVYIKKSGV